MGIVMVTIMDMDTHILMITNMSTNMSTKMKIKKIINMERVANIITSINMIMTMVTNTNMITSMNRQLREISTSTLHFYMLLEICLCQLE